MNINERRLNGRDVLAKTFPAKTKKGYDPIDVDAYLELVASQVDLLHDDIARAGSIQAPSTEAAVASTVGSTDQDAALVDELATIRAELDAAVADRDIAVAERDALEKEFVSEVAAAEHLRAENAQLRTQLMSTAPPPPVSAAADSGIVDAVEVEEDAVEDDVTEEDVVENDVAEIVELEDVDDSEGVALVHASSSDVLVADDRASRESFELVLQAAQRTAHEAISAAHQRADEIVADANLTAERIAQESDRKAYEAANRAHGELAAINNEIVTHQNELAEIASLADTRRNELRRLGETIISWAESGSDSEVLDLRDPAPSELQDTGALDDARS